MGRRNRGESRRGKMRGEKGEKGKRGEGEGGRGEERE